MLWADTDFQYLTQDVKDHIHKIGCFPAFTELSKNAPDRLKGRMDAERKTLSITNDVCIPDGLRPYVSSPSLTPAANPAITTSTR